MENNLLGKLFLLVATSISIFFISTILVMVLWNWLMPIIFGLVKITFWQAFGLNILFNLLFGGVIRIKMRNG